MSHKRLKKLSEKTKLKKPQPETSMLDNNNFSEDESISLKEISVLEENTS
jgi:hypothetical protein